MRRTGYVWHEKYKWHNTGTYPGHLTAKGSLEPYNNFESPETKSRLAGLVEVSGLIDHLVKIPAELASFEDIIRVHTREHVHRIKEQSDHGGGDAGDGASAFGHGSYEIALLAAGGTIAATRAVLTGEVDNAYALVRPPGHHALRESGMGFCIFSNIAVAIEWARANTSAKRVAVVDYDVHHGNGTQDIYYDDPDVLTISIHQDHLYPRNSGGTEEAGRGMAEGTSINVPLPAGCGNGAYFEAIDKVVSPAITNFAPDLIMVASGFDAGAKDPLGRMSVTAEGFRQMAERLVAVADKVCGGKIVFSHEGGYSPIYVPFCGLAVLEALSGYDTGVVDPWAAADAESPTHELQAWQAQVIAKSAELAERLNLVHRVD